MSKQDRRQGDDWVKQPGRFSLYWGLPLTVMIVSACLTEPRIRTWVWVLALVWMGFACLMNAWRCGRRHCYYTGPFLIIMAVITWLHGSGIVAFGVNGYWWLGIAIGIGSGILWYFTERHQGQYARRQNDKS